MFLEKPKRKKENFRKKINFYFLYRKRKTVAETLDDTF